MTSADTCGFLSTFRRTKLACHNPKTSPINGVARLRRSTTRTLPSAQFCRQEQMLQSRPFFTMATQLSPKPINRRTLVASYRRRSERTPLEANCRTGVCDDSKLNCPAVRIVRFGRGCGRASFCNKRASPRLFRLPTLGEIMIAVPLRKNRIFRLHATHRTCEKVSNGPLRDRTQVLRRRSVSQGTWFGSFIASVTFVRF